MTAALFLCSVGALATLGFFAFALIANDVCDTNHHDES
jgi:hypothetical protein